MIKSELFYDDDRGALFEDGKLVDNSQHLDDYHIGAISILRITLQKQQAQYRLQTDHWLASV